jgi:diguanylate cyclase (GGDEF)-like protein/PAS domain S-box-containing protein
VKNENLYLNIINNLTDGVYFVDNERRIVFWNRAAEDITGYKADEIVGRKCDDNLLSHIDVDGRPLCIVGCPLYATIIDNKQRREQVFLRHKEGHRLPVVVNIFPMVEDGKTVGAIEVFTAEQTPITFKDDLVGQLSDIAMTDQLTGLPNRRFLDSILEYRVSEFRRFGHLFALVFVDIDNFGAFNNQYGHDVGDQVLKNVSASVIKSLRKDDVFGRWGGEEFVGIFPVSQAYDAPILGEKIRMLIANTEIPVDGQSLAVTASVGVTVAHAGDIPATLVERADKLMYQSKNDGKNKVNSD